MKLVILSTLIVIGLLILPAILSFFIKYIPEQEQPPLTGTVRVFHEKNVNTIITSKHDNLAIIGVSIKNPQLVNKKDLILKVYDRDGNLIREKVLNGRYIEDGKFVKFLIPPIPDSAGKTFALEFSAPQAKYEEALEIFLTDASAENVVVSGEFISIRNFYRPNGSFDVMKIVYKGWYFRMLEDKIFTIFYFSFIFLIVIALVWPKVQPPYFQKLFARKFW